MLNNRISRSIMSGAYLLKRRPRLLNSARIPQILLPAALLLDLKMADEILIGHVDRL